jgi:hypothetical protein
MSALINSDLALINMSAAHKVRVRGDSSPAPGPGLATTPGVSREQQAEAAKLDAAIAANLKELGYGG